MSKHRYSADSFLADKRRLFERTVDIIYKSIFEGKTLQQLSTSVLEATLVGVSLNLDFVESQPAANIKAMYDNMLNKPEFSEEKLREGLAGKEKVLGRMSTAKRAFSSR